MFHIMYLNESYRSTETKKGERNKKREAKSRPQYLKKAHILTKLICHSHIFPIPNESQ